MRDLKGPWQCKRSGCKDLLLFSSFPSWLWLCRVRKDGTALLWRVSALLSWLSQHCTCKVTPPGAAASLYLMFRAIPFCWIHGMVPRRLNSQNPDLVDGHNQKHTRRCNFLCAERGGCWPSPETSTGSASPAFFFSHCVSLFQGVLLNLIIPHIIVMQIKTDHTFSCAHHLTSSKKNCSEVFIKMTCTFYKISVSINC